jgi:hypothetical protein
MCLSHHWIAEILLYFWTSDKNHEFYLQSLQKIIYFLQEYISRMLNFLKKTILYGNQTQISCVNNNSKMKTELSDFISMDYHFIWNNLQWKFLASSCSIKWKVKASKFQYKAMLTNGIIYNKLVVIYYEMSQR